MANTVLIQTQVAAMNIDSLNSDAISATDLNNGAVVARGALSSEAGKHELFTVAAPEAVGTNLWMVYSPEVVDIKSGNNIYRGLSEDPREFTNIAGRPLNIFKPMVGDLITVTADAFSTSVGSNAFANQVAESTKLTPAAEVGEGLAFKVLSTSKYISIGNERVPAVLLECVNN